MNVEEILNEAEGRIYDMMERKGVVENFDGLSDVF
jgi:hypothetical protein